MVCETPDLKTCQANREASGGDSFLFSWLLELFSNMFHTVGAMFSSPVPQALRLAWHTEAVPVVGKVAVNKQENREWISTHSLPPALPTFSRISSAVRAQTS